MRISTRWNNTIILPVLLLLTLGTSTTSALQRNNNNSKKPLPRPLQHHTRGGGYASTRTKKRRVHNWLRSSATATAPHTRSPPRIQRPPWRLEDDRDGDMALLFPSQWDQQEAQYHHQQQQQHYQQEQESLSYVDELKRQVARTSEEAALQDAIDSTSKRRLSLSRLDLTLFGTYFLHCVAMTLPIVLLPLVAAEHVATSSHVNLSVAAVVATIASVSTFGGGLGKCLNGFVCQSLGGSRSSALYLVGWAGAAFLLSTSPAAHAGWILALMEFLASIQWTACSLVLANHYAERSPTKFSRGITILSLASTTGTLMAKTGGTALLKYFDNSWRAVAQFGSVTALLGAAIIRLASEHPHDHRPRPTSKTHRPNLGQSLRAVMGSPLFWQVGIAHATAMLARTSDRILGAFFHQTTALPRSVCGGLTAFVTMGFVHGLMKGRKFHSLQDIGSKTQMLSKAYSVSALSAVGMALCANDWIQSLFFPSKHILAATMATLTGILASNISFQFYQIPAMTAAAFFGPNKALCLSLLDGLGFLLAAPVWAMTGKIVELAGPHGWTLAWVMLAGMFAAGGQSMMTALPSILQRQQQQQRRAAS